MAPTTEHGTENHVAIVGMACRLPGAGNVTEFWQNLLSGTESLTVFTDDELLASGIAPELVRSPHYVKSRGIIGGADAFDAAFFGFTPREAELLDPQQRVFLECAWHALEDAGCVPGQTGARIAVFGGVGTNWHLGDVSQHPDVRKFSSAASVVTSNDKDYLTTRVSYKLGLTGPSVNVQSACSTSLVAAVLGIGSLLSYQCDLALAGGATIELPEKKGYLYQEGGMESPDGRCRPFDAQAKGTVFSRGAGVVLLKRLSDAIRDRDHIYAVIREGAVNNDGSSKVGFTAPSVPGQVEVAVEALERAGVSPDTLSFVEAHGTATSLGDPIEVTSLSQAFRHYTQARQFCALGSVKGNIGHVDVASGAAGLIKSAMALKTGLLPASINFETPNPKIDFASSPFFVNTTLRELPKGDSPRRALINAFGVGGTNACLILEEPPVLPVAEARGTNVLLLSARTPAALDAMTDRLRAHVEANPGIPLDEVAFTCQTGRRAFQQRRWVPYATREELLARLARSAPGMADAACPVEGRGVVFAFPGQGNQYPGMGRGLYEHEPVFRNAIDAGAALLQPALGADLREVMYAEGADAAARLNQTCFTQPAIFLTSYAMAKLWMSWDIQPAAFVGHSVGEYVAACLSGVMSFEDALRAVARRGQLIQALPGGSMLAVLRSEAQVLPYLSPALSVAAVNGPALTVVAGPTGEIAALEERLRGERIFSKRLDTSHAFHSAMMDAALEPFAEALADVPLSAPSLPIASTLSGTWLTPGEATSTEYWVQHMRRPVRFLDALQTLTGGDTPYIILECGPGHSLASAAKHIVASQGPHTVLGSMRAETDPGSDMETLMSAAGALWAAGRPIDWRRLYREQPRRASLPGYPFERQSFALEFWRLPAATAAPPKNDAKKEDVGEWFYLPAWQRTAPVDLRPDGAAGAEPPAAHTWLLFEDTLGIAGEVEDQLTAAGDLVVIVRDGDGFAQTGTRSFTLRAGVRSDYDDLAASLKNAGIRPDRVLHLWNVRAAAATPSVDSAAACTERAFFSPLFIEQALIKQNMLEGLSVVVAASHVFDVTGEPVQDPGAALALGPCRVVGKEFPMMRARFVDLAPPSARRPARAIARDLIAEANFDSTETVVAYRGAYRWTETFEPVRLQPAKDLASRLRDEGVYVITGGLGGLGLFFASQIAESVKAPRFVLTHRAPMPPRDQWQAWLDQHGPDDATARRISGVLAIEAAGASVMLACAASENREAMAAVIAGAEARFGAINGVIHAAGVAGGGVISLKTEAMAAEVLEPKVQGTLVLDELLRDKGLDFIALLSSVTSVLGEPGRVDYCSANAFMDAMAHYRRDDPASPIIAMNFGSWAEFGMAARWEERKAARAGQLKARRAPNGPRLVLASRESGQQIYDVLFDPESDWCINTHRVFGVPTAVGTSFLGLVAEFMALEHPGRTPSLRGMTFVSPLMFEPGAQKRVRLLVREQNGAWRFSIRSQVSAAGAPDVWHEHFRGEVTAEAPADVPRVDLAALQARFSGDADRSGFIVPHEGPNTPVLDLGERWDCLTELKSRDGEWLARVELPERFAADLDDDAFHPAVADVAMAAAVRHAVDSLHLPAGYGAIVLRDRYPSKVWSHIRRRTDTASADSVEFDITIAGDDGRELARIERYSLKRVTASAPPPAPASRRAAAGAPPAPGSRDVLPAEGWDAFTRILTGPAVPQVIVSSSDLYQLIADEQKGKPGTADEPQKPAAASGYSRPSLSTPFEEPANEIEKAIADIWGGILGIAQIGANDDFTELGGNSLLAVQAVANTADAFRVDLPVDAFYGKPTVRGLAETVVELLVGMAGEETLDDLLSSLETH